MTWSHGIGIDCDLIYVGCVQLQVRDVSHEFIFRIRAFHKPPREVVDSAFDFVVWSIDDHEHGIRTDPAVKVRSYLVFIRIAPDVICLCARSLLVKFNPEEQGPASFRDFRARSVIHDIAA